LQAAPSILGPWTNYTGAVSPLTILVRGEGLFSGPFVLELRSMALKNLLASDFRFGMLEECHAPDTF
jgi:hypothetical protein